MDKRALLKINDIQTQVQSDAFWRWATLPADFNGDPQQFLDDHEYRVLSKGASGGGFLVPTDVGDKITAAARAVSAVAQVALEVVTEKGETVGMSLAGTHGTAAWVSESAAYTPADETITQQNMGAYKAGTKIIVSEELRTDEEVELDSYLAFELGARLGALQEAAFCTGDGSGKPLGIVHATPARVGSGRGAADRVQLTARPERTRPIDAAVAVALAVQGATIEAPGSVYDSRGLIAV